MFSQFCYSSQLLPDFVLCFSHNLLLRTLRCTLEDGDEQCHHALPTVSTRQFRCDDFSVDRHRFSCNVCCLCLLGCSDSWHPAVDGGSFRIFARSQAALVRIGLSTLSNWCSVVSLQTYDALRSLWHRKKLVHFRQWYLHVFFYWQRLWYIYKLRKRVKWQYMAWNWKHLLWSAYVTVQVVIFLSTQPSES